ncbi:MAG: dethiobiotin synthase [Gammaproteobacteria bacterium]
MKPCSIFVSATDTGVGKTLISSLILAAMDHYGYSLQYFKPIQTGEDSDCDEVKLLANLSEHRISRPVYHFPLPMAGWRAAAAAGSAIDLSAIATHFAQQPQPCVVEGAGGLLNPLTPTETLRELIQHLQLPVVVVASTRLGTLNHTLLTCEAVQRAAIPLKGVILSGPTDIGLAQTLQAF